MLVFDLFRGFFDVFKLTRTRPLTPESDDSDKLDVKREILTVMDSERVQINDNGELVGITAIIQNSAIIKSQGILPSGYWNELPPADKPRAVFITFEDQENAILTAAACTSLLVIETSKATGISKQQYYGTAFFVSERHLLTAGHNALDQNGNVPNVRITHPGLSQIHSWQVYHEKIPTISCHVVGTIYKPDGAVSKDIAILQVTDNSFSATRYLPLSKGGYPGTMVDIIGYPDEIRYEWIEAHGHGVDREKGREEAKRLFMEGNLTVTRGNIETVGSTMSYRRWPASALSIRLRRRPCAA